MALPKGKERELNYTIFLFTVNLTEQIGLSRIDFSDRITQYISALSSVGRAAPF